MNGGKNKLIKIWSRLSALYILTMRKKTGMRRRYVEEVLFFLNRYDKRPILSRIKKGNDGFSVATD